MRLKLDENLPSEAVEILREAGHDAESVLDERLGGSSDPDIARVCGREDRSLITLDRGFADIRVYPPEQHRGIVVLRLHRQDKVALLTLIRRLVSVLNSEPMQGCLWIVDEQRVRIRP